MARNPIVDGLRAGRDLIVNSQESRGFSQNERLVIVCVISSLFMQLYNAVMPYCAMLWNPILELLLHLARLFLETLIYIFENVDWKAIGNRAIILLELVVGFVVCLAVTCALMEFFILILPCWLAVSANQAGSVASQTGQNPKI